MIYFPLLFLFCPIFFSQLLCLTSEFFNFNYYTFKSKFQFDFHSYFLFHYWKSLYINFYFLNTIGFNSLCIFLMVASKSCAILTWRSSSLWRINTSQFIWLWSVSRPLVTFVRSPPPQFYSYFLWGGLATSSCYNRNFHLFLVG